MDTQDTPGYCSDLTLSYGRQKSAIRELFEYGKKISRDKGPEQVFDFSIGKPRVTSPRQDEEAF